MPNSYDTTSCSCFFNPTPRSHEMWSGSDLGWNAAVVVRNLTITHITSLEYLKMDGDIAASLPKKVKTHAAKIIAEHSEWKVATLLYSDQYQRKQQNVLEISHKRQIKCSCSTIEIRRLWPCAHVHGYFYKCSLFWYFTYMQTYF